MLEPVAIRQLWSGYGYQYADALTHGSFWQHWYPKGEELYLKPKVKKLEWTRIWIGTDEWPGWQATSPNGKCYQFPEPHNMGGWKQLTEWIEEKKNAIQIAHDREIFSCLE